MPQFLYRIQPTRLAMLTEGPTPQEQEIVSAHFDYLAGLLERGVLILAGRTLNADPDSFGIAIFNADSEAHAAALVADDPAVKGGVMRSQLFPYRIALIAESNIKEQ